MPLTAVAGRRSRTPLNLRVEQGRSTELLECVGDELRHGLFRRARPSKPEIARSEPAEPLQSSSASAARQSQQEWPAGMVVSDSSTHALHKASSPSTLPKIAQR